MCIVSNLRIKATENIHSPASLGVTYYSKALLHIHSLNLISLSLQIRTQAHGGTNRFSQGHTARKEWS